MVEENKEGENFLCTNSFMYFILGPLCLAYRMSWTDLLLMILAYIAMDSAGCPTITLCHITSSTDIAPPII